MSSSLLILVLTCTYAVLTASLAQYALQGNATDLQQNSLNGLSRLVDELSESSTASVTVGSSPAGIVFVSPRDNARAFQFNAAGDLLWQRYICYYLGTVNGLPALIRKEEKLTSTQTTPPPIPASKTTAYFSSLSVTPLAIGINVTGISFSGTNPVLITLTTNHSALGKRDEIQMSAQACLRN